MSGREGNQLQRVDTLKDEKAHLENGADNTRWEDHAVRTMPESLRGLAPEDRAAMGKKMVRKMDLVIL
jgi:hypothetical protein